MICQLIKSIESKFLIFFIFVRITKKPLKCRFSGLLTINVLKNVGLPGFEPGQTEPKPVVLPLHHSPNFLVFSSENAAKISVFMNTFQIISDFFSVSDGNPYLCLQNNLAYEEKNIVHIVAGDYFCTCHGGYSAMDA